MFTKMKNLIDVSRNVAYCILSTIAESSVRAIIRAVEIETRRRSNAHSQIKEKVETSSGRINALVTRYQLLSRACLIQRFNCAFNLFQKSCFCSVIERVRETEDYSTPLHPWITKRRRALRKQACSSFYSSPPSPFFPDLVDPLKSKKAVTLCNSGRCLLRPDACFVHGSLYYTAFLCLSTGFRPTQLLFYPPYYPATSSRHPLFSSAALYLKSIDTFMQYRLSNAYNA